MTEQEAFERIRSGKYQVTQRTRFSKKIVVFVVASVHIFTIIALVMFYLKGIEPSTLIVSYFGFMGVEVLGIAVSTWGKNKQE